MAARLHSTLPSMSATESLSVVMIGATGAVGNHTAITLASLPGLQRLTLLGRRAAANVSRPAVTQHTVDALDPASYRAHLPHHRCAVCTLGVGEPSKVDRAQFVRIDRDAVLDFARECKGAGVRHFELLGSIGSSATSRSFYLRTKGELEEGLKALGFERLSLFRPSMILTPTNRYGLTQAIALQAMPLLQPLLAGALRPYRGIRVEQLGRAIALNTTTAGSGTETLTWDAIVALAERG
jgi:uncharacterized protein YbjT (DUF2867 family)